ncbi:MAG: PLP-dependent aminotransferase family protein [Actinomycetota bacterium]|nr:PLP-dependent aminotransferase family protein [Actinomycetota bacterium]
MSVAPVASPLGTQEAVGWADRLAKGSAGQDGVLTAILALANAKGLVNFSGGFPAPELFPTDTLARIAGDLIQLDAAVALQYTPSEGLATTREAIAGHLEQLEGIRPAADELMITSGGIDAVTLVGKSMLDRGDIVAVEEPTYVGAVTGFEAFRPVLRGVPMDVGGLDVERLAYLVDRGETPKLVYVIPEYQNPSGRTLALERRHALVELCRRHRILIVEDVAYRELGFGAERLPSLWSLAPDVVVQIGTFSKTFFPGVRLGWAAGPTEVVAQLVVAKQNSDQCSGALGQRLVEEFLRGGHFASLVARERAFYRCRGEAMNSALRRHMTGLGSWTEATGGFFSWLHVPGVDTAVLALAAREEGVAFVPGSPFFAEHVSHEHLRLAFSRATEADIEDGISKLARLIAVATR